MTDAKSARRISTARWLRGLLALAITLLALWGIRSLEVEADVISALSGNSEGYLAYEAFQERFELGAADEALLVRADDLAEPEAFAALEDLILDLQFTDGVSEVVSLFSLPAEGTTTPLILADDTAPLAERFETFAEAGPAAGALVSSTRDAALLHVIAVQGAERGDIASALPALIEAAAPLDVAAVGQAEVERQISANLLRDQMLVTPVAVLICIIVAALILRSVRAVAVCAPPAICGVLWFLGLLGWAGHALDPWLATLPMLVMVLAFADTLHLFYASREEGGLEKAVHNVMPAAFMTSLTSALALASFGFAGSDALWGLAVWGPAAVFSGFVAVYLLFPLLSRLLIRGEINHPAGFSLVMAPAQSGLRHPRTMAVIALAVVIGLIPGVDSTEPDFSLSEHIRDDSPLGHDLQFMEEEGLGSASLFVMIDDADGSPGLSPEDGNRIARVASLALSGPSAVDDDETPMVPERFRADDGLAVALPVLVPLGNGPERFGAELERLQTGLEEAELDSVARLAGQSLLAHEVVPETVDAMRSSFYIALAAITLVVAISQRSLPLAVLATAVSALPMMAIEGVLYLSGRGMTMTAAIALTVAFGIAVDNTIHYLNRWKRSNGPRGTRLGEALGFAGPPMVASTLIMTLGFGATLLSATASMPQFGLFVISALWMALVAALWFLPALIRLVRRKEI
ncbi:efflux RND transporter permease subunit [Gymnodinialimonas ceratoperidinii]|uniref:MMPL family transporter n=1 Tax=Gymnodinialimonas ceratoperidinii TaxID=2856823 RepID=A0A8F6TTC5_9RHOB|nr:MMPL family transporter [Gymnodinialimonas ceratoperidinii]QXT38576.1 MMPL family transporter [Gymnodinialimonas ceratoperidinii]